MTGELTMRTTHTLSKPLSCPVILVCSGLVLVLATAVFGADWPNWRGPNHNGISTETGWQTNWPQPGPKLLWEALVGIGFSSIAVSDGRVYTMGNISENDIIWCFDAESGKLLWRYSYPSPKDAKYYEGGPSATPTIHNGKVYTLSKRGKFFCLDAATGKVLFTKDLQKDLGIKIPTWGLASSALIVGDKIFFNAATAGLALNISDGSLVWKNGSGPAGYATPVPFSYNGKTYLAIFGARELFVVAADSGQILARFPWKTGYDVNAADPIIVAGNKIFISSGYNKGCALLKLTSKGLTAIWQNKNMRNHFNSCIFWQGHIYGIDERTLKCLNLDTGEELWRKSGYNKGSLILADGKIILLGERGKLAVAPASPQGFNELAVAPILSGKCWTTPVLANGRIYARNAKGRLVCVDVKG